MRRGLFGHSSVHGLESDDFRLIFMLLHSTGWTNSPMSILLHLSIPMGPRIKGHVLLKDGWSSNIVYDKQISTCCEVLLSLCCTSQGIQYTY
jgi:hypothetical protein